MNNLISPSQAFGKLKEKSIVLIDVREKNEHDAGHIKGSILVPLSTFDLNLIPKTHHPIVFYCRSGARSDHAMHLYLAEHPEAEVYNLNGGILNWEAQGLDLV